MLASIPCKETEPFLHAGVGFATRPQRFQASSPGRAVEMEPTDRHRGPRHTPDDKAAHIRAYLKPTMEVTKCHEDVQQGGGTKSHNGAILRYVATYDMKFSSSLDTEWLSGGGSDYSAAVGAAKVACAGARNVAHAGTRAISASQAERQHP